MFKIYFILSWIGGLLSFAYCFLTSDDDAFFASLMLHAFNGVINFIFMMVFFIYSLIFLESKFYFQKQILLLMFNFPMFMFFVLTILIILQ